MKRWLIALALLVSLIALEHFARAGLADRSLVNGLLAPGAHSALTAVALGLGYLALRLGLLVAVPALLAAAIVIVVISKVCERWQARARSHELSSSGPEGPGGQNAQEP